MNTDVEPINTPESRYVDVNGLRLHYVDWGNERAPTLVLLHGHCSNIHTFDQLADRLCNEWHVMALDQRGHGDSEWAPRYDREAFVADFQAFVEAIGLSSFSLLGHSMGGLVGMQYVASVSNFVERFVIVDIGPEIILNDGTKIGRETVDAPEQFDSLEDVYVFLRATDPKSPEGMLRYRTKHAVRQLDTGKWGWKYDPGLRSGAGFEEAPSSEELWVALALIDCPTLVVRGERSEILAKDVAERMEQVLSDGRLVEIGGSGHRITLDNLDGLEREVRSFLAEVRGS